MNSHLLALIRKYRNRGILIDTNIALLYLVGSVDLSLVRNHSRTSKYSEDDFERVSKFVESFVERITTPHILTEISNLLGKRNDFFSALRGYIIQAEEVHLTGKALAGSSAFFDFGLTDSAIFETAIGHYLVVTDDGPLYGFLESKKVDVVSLNQLRMI